MEFLKANYDWIFSGAGIVILAGLATFFRKTLVKGMALFSGKIKGRLQKEPVWHKKPRKRATAGDMDSLRQTTNILFIDDDTRFRVVSMLRKWGWVNTRLVKDIPAIDDEKVQSAHIVFVDIYGTGRAMGFTDEGLGLALALKNKYGRSKKVVIYSENTKGNVFHEALQKADHCLPKKSDPYEFLRLVERWV